MEKELVLKMKELSRKARERGKITPITEAYKKYPVEDEYHKGKLEYWLQGDKRLEM